MSKLTYSKPIFFRNVSKFIQDVCRQYPRGYEPYTIYPPDFFQQNKYHDLEDLVEAMPELANGCQLTDDDKSLFERNIRSSSQERSYTAAQLKDSATKVLTMLEHAPTLLKQRDYSADSFFKDDTSPLMESFSRGVPTTSIGNSLTNPSRVLTRAYQVLNQAHTLITGGKQLRLIPNTDTEQGPEPFRSRQ